MGASSAADSPSSSSFCKRLCAAVVLAAAVVGHAAGFQASQPAPLNGSNGQYFPAVATPRDQDSFPRQARVSRIVKTVDTDGIPHYRWDSQFRSEGYLAMLYQDYGAVAPFRGARLDYHELFDYDHTALGVPDPLFVQDPTQSLPPQSLAFGSRLPINLFASPSPGDFLDPSPTLGGTSVPLLPPGTSQLPTGWHGLNRPTLEGSVDLVTGVPLARVVDLELPFDGATFRISRTRSATREESKIGSDTFPEEIGDEWWDWTGVGWMTGENPLLLIDSAVPDLSPWGNRTTWLVLDAFHSIPFQFIESAGQYEAPPRFRATLTHDGVWGTATVNGVTKRGWKRRPQEYTVSLYDGVLHHTFTAIQKGGVTVSNGLADPIVDCEDVPPHAWHDSSDTTYPKKLRSMAERWSAPEDAASVGIEFQDYFAPMENQGLGLPTLGLCSRIEDNHGHVVEIHYSPTHEYDLRDAAAFIDDWVNASDHSQSANHHADGLDDANARALAYSEVYQDTFRRGQLNWIELKTKQGGSETTRWTLVYAHRRFEGVQGDLRRLRDPASGTDPESERVQAWLNVPTPPAIDRFAAFRDDLDCNDGSLAIDGVYAFEGAITGVETKLDEPITISQHQKYPIVDGRVLLTGTDDAIETFNQGRASNLRLPTNWRHRVRHFYRFNSQRYLDDSMSDANPLFGRPLGAPILIKTTVTNRPSDTSPPTSRNSVYQYRTFKTLGGAGTDDAVIAMDESVAARTPFTERGFSNAPWLERIFTDSDIARLHAWASDIETDDPLGTIKVSLQNISTDDLARRYSAALGVDNSSPLQSPSAAWGFVNSFASVEWVAADRTTRSIGWSETASSNFTPAFNRGLPYFDQFEQNASHLFGGDYSSGTVCRFCLRSAEQQNAYQINRIVQGPSTSQRGPDSAPGLIPVMVVAGSGQGCYPMRSRFVAPYYWSAFPNGNVGAFNEGSACWGQAPELDKARWIVVVDAYKDRDSICASSSYGAGALRPGMVSRRVAELNPSGVTIRDRSWDIKTGNSTTVQPGFVRTYHYERADKLFVNQFAALHAAAGAGDTRFDAFGAELLMTEERSFGFSSLYNQPSAQTDHGLIQFHDYQWTDFGYDTATDSDGNKTVTPHVPWSSFIAANATGVKRGTDGTKFYTQQVFRAPASERRPDDIRWEVQFMTPRTTPLSAPPSGGQLGTTDYQATQHIVLHDDTKRPNPWEHLVKAVQVIKPGRRLFPGGDLYYPVEKQWFDDQGQQMWSATGFIRGYSNAVGLHSGSAVWDGFESLTFNFTKIENGRLLYSIIDTPPTTVTARTPGRWETGSASEVETWDLAVDAYPDSLVRIPLHTSSLGTPLAQATVYAYDGPGGTLSDIWYPDGRRYARRVFEFMGPASPQDILLGDYSLPRHAGWSEEFEFGDLVRSATGWKCLKPGKWTVTFGPAGHLHLGGGEAELMGEFRDVAPLTWILQWQSVPSSMMHSTTGARYSFFPVHAVLNPGTIELDVGATGTTKLVEVKSVLDGNGRMTGAKVLERDVTGVMVSVGTKETNDLVDVLREREIDGTLTRTTRDFFGHALRRYSGTNDTTWVGTHLDPDHHDNMIMVERQEYGVGETDAWMPTVHRRYDSIPAQANLNFADHFGDIPAGEDAYGIPTVTSYDWRMRPVRVDSYAKGVYTGTTRPPRLSTKLTYIDCAGRTRWEVLFGADTATHQLSINAALDPVQLAGAQLLLTEVDVHTLMQLPLRPISITEYVVGSDGNVNETRSYDVGANVASGTPWPFQSTFTYRGLTGQEVYAQRPGQPVQIQVLHPSGRLEETIMVRPGSDAASVATRYELSRTEITYDTEQNPIGRVSWERTVYDTSPALTSSNAVASYEWSWFDAAKRLVATADVGTGSVSSYTNGTTPTRPTINSDVTWQSVHNALPGARVNAFTYDSAGQQIESYDAHGVKTTKTYTGTAKVAQVTEDAAGTSPRTTAYRYKWGRLESMEFDRTPGSNGAKQRTRLWFSETDSTDEAHLRVLATKVVDKNFNEVSANGAYVGKVWFPNRSDGSAATTDDGYPTEADRDFRFSYNFAGQIAEREDARGVVFRYSYDDLGRLSEIQVGHYEGVGTAKTFYPTYPDLMNCATGVPQDRIERVMFEYDDRGNQILVTAKTADGVITQNQFDYSHRDELVREWQSLGGVVSTANDTYQTPSIDYEWSWAETNGSSATGHHRLTKMTYPANPSVLTRREIAFAYGAPGSIDDQLSRITAMNTNIGIFGSAYNIAGFDWSGTGRRARQTQANSLIARDSRSAGSVVGYDLLDQFGRTRDFAFRNTLTGADPANVLYRAKYYLDAVGNRLASEITERRLSGAQVNAQSVFNTYDAFNRLVLSAVGQLNQDATALVSNSTTRADAWTLDLLGNWTGTELDPGRLTTFYAGGSATGSTALSTDVNERNELGALHPAANGVPGDKVYLQYDQSGNMVYDGSYFYQYDAWGRLIQINRTLPYTGTLPPPVDPCPSYEFDIGPMVKHFSYDGLGRLVRVQSPWPTPETASGGVRSERFYYDGARRVQEVITDPLATPELAMGTANTGSNPGLSEILYGSVPAAILASADPQASPLSFESAQLGNPSPLTGLLEEPLPEPLSALEREYVWGPGDNGLDELLVQYDRNRQPWWMIQDGGGDVVAMCDLGGTGTTARVVHTWQYDAYGKCVRAEQLINNTLTYVVPQNRCGHKGLFMDRLDVGLADSTTLQDNPRLAVNSVVLYQNRNRTYSPQLGRFIQRDPSETGQLLAAMAGYQGMLPAGSGGSFGLESLYGDGGSLYGYLRCSPWTASDSMGLEFTFGGMLSNMAVGAVVGGAIGGTLTGIRAYANGEDWNEIGRQATVGVGAGAIGGAMLGTGLYGASWAGSALGLTGTGAVAFGTAGGAVVGGLSAGVESMISQYGIHGAVDWNEVALAAGAGAVTGGVLHGWASSAAQADEQILQQVGLRTGGNPLKGLARVGSALKSDPYHAFPDIVDNFATQATRTPLRNGAELLQLEGSLNKIPGRFEWIINGGEVTHRLFVANGAINGIPTTP